MRTASDADDGALTRRTRRAKPEPAFNAAKFHELLSARADFRAQQEEYHDPAGPQRERSRLRRGDNRSQPEWFNGATTAGDVGLGQDVCGSGVDGIDLIVLRGAVEGSTEEHQASVALVGGRTV